ncbi:MAG: hypothetical protein LBM19_01870 [Holosporales bacterium]|nr:hypothetical protein [Holosporales bacterium]
MKKVNFFKMLTVASFLCCVNVGSASNSMQMLCSSQSEMRTALSKLKEMGITRSSVEVFSASIQGYTEPLIQMIAEHSECDPEGEILLAISYLSDIKEIVDEVLNYHEHPSSEQKTKLLGYASTYGGEMGKLIDSEIKAGEVAQQSTRWWWQRSSRVGS